MNLVRCPQHAKLMRAIWSDAPSTQNWRDLFGRIPPTPKTDGSYLVRCPSTQNWRKLFGQMPPAPKTGAICLVGCSQRPKLARAIWSDTPRTPNWRELIIWSDTPSRDTPQPRALIRCPLNPRFRVDLLRKKYILTRTPLPITLSYHSPVQVSGVKKPDKSKTMALA